MRRLFGGPGLRSVARGALSRIEGVRVESKGSELQSVIGTGSPCIAAPYARKRGQCAAERPRLGSARTKTEAPTPRSRPLGVGPTEDLTPGAPRTPGAPARRDDRSAREAGSPVPMFSPDWSRFVPSLYRFDDGWKLVANIFAKHGCPVAARERIKARTSSPPSVTATRGAGSGCDPLLCGDIIRS